MSKNKKNTKFYSDYVFDEQTMKKYLSDATYKAFIKTIDSEEKLNLDVANKIAKSMKNWALEKGATHFTHWFQPLRGTTSEKHDSFLVPSADKGKAIFAFSGKDLIKGESDASSLPSGGLRASFEARGYTAWDPTSNAFIKDEVLCIPTAFCSYNGDALDEKTPLLRSMDALKAQVKRFMRFFNKDVKNVVVNIGAEQEFFLIPKNDYASREDLVMTGRTLFGNKPCKGQELEEHYFGAIRPTVNKFMKKLDKELWSLGIAAHTKHNETAPSQHELAPIYTDANQAIDQNLIMMEKMQLLASKYNLACLLHEKPFKGINGSGKHCNWSIVADKINLLDPGKNENDNLRFISVLACVITAVDKYQELLRMSVASAGNDERLGGYEAPPAIVSIYLGKELEAMIEGVINNSKFQQATLQNMDLGASVLPIILKDSSDRNRTSPFAFSANKFEFRMPGSQVNLSDSVTVLNAAFTNALDDFCNSLEVVLKANIESQNCNKFSEAVLNVCSKFLNAHKRILYSGDGYSDDWIQEASKRGLAYNKNTAHALTCMTDKSTIDLFEKYNILSKREIYSRYAIKLDKYNKIINIEANVMQRMVRRTYLPAISSYASKIAQEINNFKLAAMSTNISEHQKLLEKLLSGIQTINERLKIVADNHKVSTNITDQQERANFISNNLIPSMKNLRDTVDEMEHITGRDYWPVPSYNNMLFYV